MSGATAHSRLNYERRGEGPPLVLLHGIGHRWQAWEPVLGILAAEHDVIAVDLPGFGKSPPMSGAHGRRGGHGGRGTGGAFGAGAIATVIAEFSGDLGLGRPHVAGNSLGGGVALELAATGRASSATALSPVGFWTPGEYWWDRSVLQILRATTFLPVSVLQTMMRSAAVRALAFGMVVHRPARIAPEHLLGDALALRDCVSFAPVARALRGYAFAETPQVPVTVAWGANDRILPHRQARRARQRLPGARHVGLPGCGHVPMSDNPALVASTILATAKEATA